MVMKVAMKAEKKKTAVVADNGLGLTVAATAGKLAASVAKNAKEQPTRNKREVAVPTGVMKGKRTAAPMKGRPRKVMKVATKKPVEEEESEDDEEEEEEKAAPMKAMKAAAGKPTSMKLKATRAKMAMKAVARKGPKAEAEESEDSESSDEEEETDEDEKQEKAGPMKAMKGVPAAKGGKGAKEDNEKDVVARRKKELSAMGKTDLQDLIISKGLEKGLKDEMVDALLSQEAGVRKEQLAREAKVRQVISQKQAELKAQKKDDLKELCVAKGLKTGGSNVDRVERLLTHAKDNGDVDKILAGQAREARKQELASMDKDSLVKLCEKAQLDPLVKEVMVERILSHEGDTGVTTSLAPTRAKEAATKVMKVMKLKATRAKMAMKAKKAK